MPFLAFEDRGARIIAYPSGTQITRPVRSIFVSPGVRSVSSKTARSNATAPGVLYTGKGTSGSSRRIIHGMFIDSHFASNINKPFEILWIMGMMFPIRGLVEHPVCYQE